MERRARRTGCIAVCAGAILLAGTARAQDQPTPSAPDKLSAVIKQNLDEQAARLEALRAELARQDQQIAQLKRTLAAQEADYHALRHAVGLDVLDQQRGGNGSAAGRMSTALPMPDVAPPVAQSQDRPVGRAPERDQRPPEVAPIFDQPGVLTARGKLVVEPSYQFAYSSNERVALIGYTVIPAVLIGLVDARQVKTTTQTGALALRYGVSNRMEVELRIPYVYGHTDTISREIFTGSATDKVFTSHGHGIGDIEATARYQMNDGGADRAYYIGWLRVKSRTGKDPFEVTTDCVSRCVQNTTGTGLPLELPRGSGFYSVQPGLTWLFPSDPVVFFGNVSYLHNFPRSHVTRTVLAGGKEPLGTVKVGDIVDASVGMGLALNEKASFSIGYDMSLVGLTRQNGQKVAGTARSVLGTLLVGGSYRYDNKRTLNFTLGVGVTRDTPDATVTVRVPMMY